MKTANITLTQCIETLKSLCDKEIVYVDEVPEILQEDFNNFIIGKTLSLSENNRSVTYDIKAYYKKIMTQGTTYPIKWIIN